jgi:hypothetical protein
MDQDDLPPRPARPIDSDAGFTGELGRTFAGFFWVALFVAIAGGAVYALMHFF